MSSDQDTHGTLTDAEAPPCYEKHHTVNTDPKQTSTQTDEASSSSQIQPDSCSGTRKSKSFIGRLMGTVTRSRQEARATVMTNIRRLMHNPRAASQDWENLLKSCDSICSEESLLLAYVLQEHFIEGHTPLYWAIIKRDEGDPITDPDLFTILLKIAAPLTEPTVSDIYCACIVASDQALFQSLRSMPDFSRPTSGTDQLLLSHTSDRDKVTVDDIPGVNGSFLAGFEIAQFRKRMRVSQDITVEFIARGRMWRLTFFISSRDMGRRPRGSWCMSLCLLNHSPPTFIDGRLVIDEYKSRSWTAAPIARAKSIANPSKSSIIIPCQSYRQLLSTDSSKHNALIMALEDSPIGSSVQHKGNSFIGPDETLRFGLYALLRKPSGVDPHYIYQDSCIVN